MVEHLVAETVAATWGLTGPMTELPEGSMSRAWRIDLPGGPPVVAKLAVNTLEHFIVGLRMSQLVQAARITSGVPTPTAAGELAVSVMLGEEVRSLTVMEHVPGRFPTDPHAVTPFRLGTLLGRVHAAVADTTLPGGWTLADVTDHTRLGILPDHPSWVRPFVEHALDAAEAWTAATSPRMQLLRGDGPGLQMDGDTVVGMIDWGATRWGPVCDDIGCWTVHAGRFHPSYAEATAALVEGYRTEAPLTEAEEAAIPIFQALRLASRPTYCTDPARLADYEAWIDDWSEQVGWVQPERSAPA